MTNEHISYKVEAYLQLNNSSSIDVYDSNLLVLSNDDNDPNNTYISHWAINLPQPTQEQLDSDSNIERAKYLLSSSMYVNNRKINYPELGNQFDMLYHELATSGPLSVSGSWFRSIQNVKDSYPKL